MHFAEYFLPFKKPGYLRQMEHNLGIKSQFFSYFAGVCNNRIFPWCDEDY